MLNKMVFIAYSWDNKEHKEWVRTLADDLVKKGIDVMFDQYDLSVGKEMTHFMERAISADKILVILTPKYKEKADNRAGGVGFEYSLLTNEILEGLPDVVKVIPILREGNKQLSCPKILATRVFHNMTEDNLYDTKFFELLKIIMDKPLVIKPKLGKLPNLDDTSKLLDVEQLISKYQDKESLFNKKERFINSERGAALYNATVKVIVDQISKTLDNYKNSFGWYFQTKVTNLSILFSTIQYTCFFSAVNSYFSSDSEADVVLNLFQGPVGLDPTIDYRGEIKEIYGTKYKFYVDDDLNPIFKRTDKLEYIFKPNDIVNIAVRDLITREIKHKEEALYK